MAAVKRLSRCEAAKPLLYILYWGLYLLRHSPHIPFIYFVFVICILVGFGGTEAVRDKNETGPLDLKTKSVLEMVCKKLTESTKIWRPLNFTKFS